MRLRDLPLKLFEQCAVTTALRWKRTTCASSALAGDIAWIWKAAPALGHMPDPRRTPQPWLGILQSLGLWKSVISTLDWDNTRLKPVTESTSSSATRQLTSQCSQSFFFPNRTLGPCVLPVYDQVTRASLERVTRSSCVDIRLVLVFFLFHLLCIQYV